MKDDLPKISYFSGYHHVKKKGCLFNLYLSGLTFHPQAWSPLINLCQEATDQVWTGKAAADQGTVQPQFTLSTTGLFQSQE